MHRHRGAQQILAASTRPDAIVCANDLTAVGVLQVLHDHGVAVPEDVIVTGFATRVLAVASQPSLTTVRQPVKEIGAEALKILRGMITVPPRPGNISSSSHNSSFGNRAAAQATRSEALTPLTSERDRQR